MKLVYATLACLALTSFSGFAFANENEDMETLYIGLCQPGSAMEKSWNAQQRREALALRGEFQGFLAAPEPVVAKMRAALANPELDMSGNLELMFTYAFTCEAAQRVADKILARGCRTDAGKQLRAERAIELCGPLGEEMRRQAKP